MPTKDQPAASSPFEIITPGKSKKVGKTGLVVGIVIVVFLILSVVAGVLLVRQQQNIQEKAVGTATCAVGYTSSHHQECKKNCTDDRAPDNSWYYINSTSGASCPAGPSGEARHLCDYDECDKSAVVITPTPTPTPTPNYQTDPNNCGGPGNICTGGMVCQAGACVFTNNPPTPTATATATATPTPTITPTPAPGQNSCNGQCGSNTNCISGLYCYSGFCRNPLCASDSTCGCGTATPTPTPTPTSTSTTATDTPTPTSSAIAETTTTQTTPLPIPVTGTDWATYAAIGAGIGAVLISLLLAL